MGTERVGIKARIWYHEYDRESESSRSHSRARSKKMCFDLPGPVFSSILDRFGIQRGQSFLMSPVTQYHPQHTFRWKMTKMYPERASGRAFFIAGGAQFALPGGVLESKKCVLTKRGQCFLISPLSQIAPNLVSNRFQIPFQSQIWKTCFDSAGPVFSSIFDTAGPIFSHVASYTVPPPAHF